MDGGWTEGGQGIWGLGGVDGGWVWQVVGSGRGSGRGSVEPTHLSHTV